MILKDVVVETDQARLDVEVKTLMRNESESADENDQDEDEDEDENGEGEEEDLTDMKSWSVRTLGVL